jgi:hypothetical protein
MERNKREIRNKKRWTRRRTSQCNREGTHHVGRPFLVRVEKKSFSNFAPSSLAHMNMLNI